MSAGTRIYRAWESRIASGTFTPGQCRAWAQSVYALAHGDMEMENMAEQDDPGTAEYAWCVAIRVRYLGPTNYKGSRWRVWRADDTYQGDPDRLERGYNHALSSSDNAVAMVNAYLKHKAAGGNAWGGRWVVAGAGSSDYIAVRAGNG